MRLSKKAQDFLNKLPKAQSGLQFPYIQGEANDLTLDTTPIMSNGVNVNPVTQQAPQLGSQPSPSGMQTLGKSLSSGSNPISTSIKLGMAVNSLIQANKAKKAYKAQKKNYDVEYKKKMGETRANDFYYTPYTVGSSSDFTAKRGGRVMQDGGQMEDFMQFYMSQKQGNQGILDTIKQSYAQDNQLAKQKYQDLQQEGIRGLGESFTSSLDQVQKALTMGMAQEGMEVEEPNLYSPDFTVDFPDDPEEQNAIHSEALQEQDFNDTLTDWIFEENDDSPSPLYETFKHVMTPSTLPAQQAISEIGKQESQNNYGIVNRSGGNRALNATGKYQFVPKFWAKSIAQFMGKPNMGESETMEAFRQSPDTQEAFMQHVVNNIYLPEVEKLRPLAKQYNLSDSEVIKLLHYRGIGDTRERLRTGNLTEVSESEKRLYNNPSPLEYIKRK